MGELVCRLRRGDADARVREGHLGGAVLADSP
jgi:hypothetical protein